MAEAHQDFFAFEFSADIRLGVFGSANLEHHIERWPRRPTVQRPLERTDRTNNCRHQIGTG